MICGFPIFLENIVLYASQRRYDVEAIIFGEFALFSQFWFLATANIRMMEVDSYKEGTTGNDFSILRRVTTSLYGRLLIGLVLFAVRFMLAETSPFTLREEKCNNSLKVSFRLQPGRLLLLFEISMGSVFLIFLITRTR